MTTRRRFLAAVAGGVGTVAGCLDGGGSDPMVSNPDDGSVTTRETPEVLAGECVAASRTWTDPVRDDVAPKPLPSGPPEMRPAAVAEFVAAYEEVYLHNTVLRPDTVTAGASTEEATVERTRYGFVVTLRSWYHYSVRGTDTESGTATEVYTDGSHVWRRYVVTESRLGRNSGSHDRKPGLRGTVVVECWSE